MRLTDIILAFALLGFVGAGVKDGFVHALGRLIGSILGFVAASAWSLKMAGALSIFMPIGWARFISFIVIFVLMTRLAGIALSLVDGVFRIISILPFLKSINNLLGGILGLFEGVILIGGTMYLVVTFKLIPSLVTLVASSTVAQWIDFVFHALLGLLL